MDPSNEITRKHHKKAIDIPSIEEYFSRKDDKRKKIVSPNDFPSSHEDAIALIFLLKLISSLVVRWRKARIYEYDRGFDETLCIPLCKFYTTHTAHENSKKNRCERGKSYLLSNEPCKIIIKKKGIENKGVCGVTKM